MDIHTLEHVFMYTTKEAAEKVGIAKPTVRKYALILEKHGYRFEKNGDRRLFLNRDLKALEQLKTADNMEKTAYALAQKQRRESDIESAIKSDIEEALQTVSPSDTLPSLIEQTEDIALLKERYNQVLSVFTGMAADFAMTRDKVDTIEESTKKTEANVEELVRLLRKEQEEKALIKEKLDIAVSFIQKSEESEQKKPFLSRLFGRG